MFNLKIFNKLYLLSFIVIASCTFSFSQDQKFFINADFANFRYDDESTYLEFYYSFNISQFNLIQTNEEFVGGAILHLRIKPIKSEELVINYRWKNPIKVLDTSEVTQPMTGVHGFQLPFGEYVASITCYDENNTASTDSIEFDIKANIPYNSLAMSDIQLSSEVTQIPRDDNNIFYKNTLQVIPNPSRIFGLGLPIATLYLEIYNLFDIKSDSIRLMTKVFNVLGNSVKETIRNKKKINETGVEVIKINCSDLPSGAYLIKCTLSDAEDTSHSVSSLKRFYIYNPQIAPLAIETKGSSMINNEFAIMSELELDREFELARYIAFPQERDQYKGLTTLESKRVFMMNFWNNRDMDDDPAVNIYKEKYRAGVQYVNMNYRTGQREGWRTDRGRVYLVYGQPDEIERHPNDMETKPYEIWYYNSLDGGSIFVFIDRSSMGDYILVHSTYRNELNDYNWENKLR